MFYQKARMKMLNEGGVSMETITELSTKMKKNLEIISRKFVELVESRPRRFKDVVSINHKIRIHGIPKEPGVYIISDEDEIIYVGSSGKGKANLKTRFRDLFYYNKNPESTSPFNHTLTHKLVKSDRFGTADEVRNFYLEKCTFRLIEMDTIRQARVLEDLLILVSDPSYNN